MPKPIVQIRNARIVPTGHHGDDDVVLIGDLASKHPVHGEGVIGFRTPVIIDQRLSSREVETLTIVYQLVD